MIDYQTIPAFDKDFKKLLKRFKTLKRDFEIMKQYSIEIFYEKGQSTSAFVPIEGMCGETFISNKVRKFTCMSLRGKGSSSGIRIIFVWEKDVRRITFIEIYFKGDKGSEDRLRLQHFIDNELKC